MIFVYGIDTHLNPIKARLSDVIHQCMHKVLGLPLDKKAQRFFPMSKADFYYPADRSDQYTVIEINMMQGRKPETIKQLIKALFTAIEQELGVSPVDVEITIKQQADHCWGFRGLTGDEAKLNYQVKV